MLRLGTEGPFVYPVTAYITHTALMNVINAVYEGDWPLREFSLWNAEQFEMVAREIRKFIETERKGEGQ